MTDTIRLCPRRPRMRPPPWASTRTAALAIATLLFAIASAIPGPGLAATVTFTDQAAWQFAIGGESNLTVFHFDGPTELDGRAANDPLIAPSYASQGVSFLPFLGTDVYPIIQRGQGHQIPDPSRDGLLGNSSSPNPPTDVIGRAIRLDFTISTNAVGVFTNRWPLDNPLGDGGYLQALDASSQVIGEVELDAGIFGGLITDVPISRVLVVNTWDGDMLFGIWDLQFANSVVTDAQFDVSVGRISLAVPSPNPSSNGATMRWTLPVAGTVRVTVHDLAGREVRVLHEGWCAEGDNRVHWDGRDSHGRRVRSGLYFIRLEASGEALTARFVALR